MYAAHFFDRNHQKLGEILQPQWMTQDDPSRDFVRAHFGRPGATTALDKALRLDSQIMLVDDPVKRVDNMTMAWGLEARTPFLDHEFAELAAAMPAGAQARPQRQGRAQGGLPQGIAGRRRSIGRRAVSRFRRSSTWKVCTWNGCGTRCTPRPQRIGTCSARTTSRNCWPTRTGTAPRSGPISCGSSACWRCGCSVMGSAEASVREGTSHSTAPGPGDPGGGRSTRSSPRR